MSTRSSGLIAHVDSEESSGGSDNNNKECVLFIYILIHLDWYLS
jgi:hypothetical protein